MESREIYDMLLRSVGEHMDTKGRAAVSINGRPALIVTIDRETGEITARNAITDTTAADAVIDIRPNSNFSIVHTFFLL